MSEYPEDVMKAAWDACGDRYGRNVSVALVIARAIMAERQRCAKIAETMKVYEIGDRFMLTAAIRKEDVAE